MGFSRQEYQSGMSCPPPGDLLDPGIEPAIPVSPALQVESLPLSYRGSPNMYTHARAHTHTHKYTYIWPQHRTPKHGEQIFTNIKKENDSNTITVGNFNTLLLSMDRSSRYNINMETLALENTLQQRNFRDTYRMFHPKAVE